MPTYSELQSQASVKSRAGWLVPGAFTGLFLALVLALVWPLDAAWHTNRAALLQTQAAFDTDLPAESALAMRNSSETLFKRALEVDPNRISAHRRYGFLLMEAENYPAAIAHLELAHQAAPDHIAARKGLGLSYLWIGEIDQAEKFLTGMRNIENELPGLAWQQYNDFQDFQKALYAYQLAERIGVDPDFARQMISLLEEKIGVQPGQ
jgi:tetratricopeptide (TPR) repeat protein